MLVLVNVCIHAQHGAKAIACRIARWQRDLLKYPTKNITKYIDVKVAPVHLRRIRDESVVPSDNMRRALGATLPVTYVPLGMPVPLLPESMQGLIGTTEMADWEIPMADTSKTFGIEPTSMDVFAQRFFTRQPASA